MISYFGAKNKFCDWINPYIPRDIKTYSEPFSGAMWIYMNPKYTFPDTLEKIVYNDFNKHMVNLFSCLKNYETFLPMLEKSLERGGFLYTDKETKDEIRKFYADIYYKYKHDVSEGNFLDNPTNDFPNYDDGLIYAYLITSSFNSVYPRSGGCSPIGKNLKPKITTLLNKLRKEEYQNKLSKITDIHNEDFENIIRKYDHKDTFFYIDAPYESSDDRRANWYGVKDSFTHQTHIRLLNLIKDTKARWAMSYYWFKELEEILPKDKYNWVEKPFFRSSAAFSSNNSVGEELLIMNYKLTDDELENNKKFLVNDDKPKKIKESKEEKIVLNYNEFKEKETVNKSAADSFWDDF